MENFNFKKWGSALLFLIVAGISCWATEHSFHLLMPQFPRVATWGITLAFFIVASLGTKWMIDALNQNVFVENRKLKFWGGLAVFIFFWLFMSMPTNTHTFFYAFNVGNVVQDDISTTQTYLSQINTRQNTDAAYNDVVRRINEQKKQLNDEFNGLGITGRRGNGQYVQQHIDSINRILLAEKTTQIPVNTNWNSADSRILNEYNAAIENRLTQVERQNYQVSTTAVTDAGKALHRLELLNDTINYLVATGEIFAAEDVVKQTEGELSIGYSVINKNAQFVQFVSEDDEATYVPQDGKVLETRTKRLLSVIDVWIDLFKGKYPGSFVYYILFSILIDIAAFLFFDFAFKQED